MNGRGWNGEIDVIPEIDLTNASRNRNFLAISSHQFVCLDLFLKQTPSGDRKSIADFIEIVPLKRN